MGPPNILNYYRNMGFRVRAVPLLYHLNISEEDIKRFLSMRAYTTDIFCYLFLMNDFDIPIEQIFEQIQHYQNNLKWKDVHMQIMEHILVEHYKSWYGCSDIEKIVDEDFFLTIEKI